MDDAALVAPTVILDQESEGIEGGKNRVAADAPRVEPVIERDQRDIRLLHAVDHVEEAEDRRGEMIEPHRHDRVAARGRAEEVEERRWRLERGQRGGAELGKGRGLLEAERGASGG